MLQARTQPKIYGGAKQIFQDLYVYIFVLLKYFQNIWVHFVCKPVKKKKIDLIFARKREKILKFHATGALK